MQTKFITNRKASGCFLFKHSGAESVGPPSGQQGTACKQMVICSNMTSKCLADQVMMYKNNARSFKRKPEGTDVKKHQEEFFSFLQNFSFDYDSMPSARISTFTN